MYITLETTFHGGGVGFIVILLGLVPLGQLLLLYTMYDHYVKTVLIINEQVYLFSEDIPINKQLIYGCKFYYGKDIAVNQISDLM